MFVSGTDLYILEGTSLQGMELEANGLGFFPGTVNLNLNFIMNYIHFTLKKKRTLKKNIQRILNLTSWRHALQILIDESCQYNLLCYYVL